MRTLLLTALLGSSLWAQTEQPGIIENYQPTRVDNASYDGAKTKLSLSLGSANLLQGYRDPLIVGGDKLDYLSSKSYSGMAELSVPFARNSSFVRDMVGRNSYLLLGIQLLAYANPQNASIDIPAIVEFDEPEVNSEIKDRTAGGIGFFFGSVQDKLEIDIGTTVFIETANEAFRLRRQADENGNIVRDSDGNEVLTRIRGRGLFIDKVRVLPNLRMRFGRADGLNLTFDVLREQANLRTDDANAYVHLPLGKHYSLDTGNGLLPFLTMFVRQNLSFGDFNLHFKTAMILSDYTDKLDNIGLYDSFYSNAGASYSF